MKTTGLHRFLSVVFSAVLFLVATSPDGRSQRIAGGANIITPAKWEVLRDCRLLDHAENDGDSFHTQHNGKDYVFRLYYVDAPETDLTLPDRVRDQAAYFNLSQDQVLQLGQEAKQFAAEFLKHGYTVVTCWQPAKGAGSQARFFGILLVGEDNLAKELVKQGLARIYGLPANWPDASRGAAFTQELKQVEAVAKASQVAGWKKVSVSAPPPSNADAPVPDVTQLRVKLMNVNSATQAELESISGIGPALAEKIIAGRPYASLEELTKVKGIKEKMLEKIRPFLTVDR